MTILLTLILGILSSIIATLLLRYIDKLKQK